MILLLSLSEVAILVHANREVGKPGSTDHVAAAWTEKMTSVQKAEACDPLSANCPEALLESDTHSNSILASLADVVQKVPYEKSLLLSTTVKILGILLLIAFLYALYRCLGCRRCLKQCAQQNRYSGSEPSETDPLRQEWQMRKSKRNHRPSKEDLSQDTNGWRRDLAAVDVEAIRNSLRNNITNAAMKSHYCRGLKQDDAKLEAEMPENTDKLSDNSQ